MSTSDLPLSINSRSFVSTVPLELVIELPKVIRAATRQAHRSHDDLHHGARRDLFPHTRHALVQHGLLELGARFGARGIQTAERLNKTKNSTHVELYVGNIVIIAAAVESDGAVVRDAAYRSSLAESPQQALPGFTPTSRPRPGAALLAAVLHGPSSLYPRTAEQAQPGFVIVRFPASDWSCYAEGRIDLPARLHASERGDEISWGPELRQQKDIA